LKTKTILPWQQDDDTQREVNTMTEPLAELYDIAVIGGGPSGATAAHDLVCMGWRVLMLDREGRIKPCGGAIPPRLIKDFDIPDHLICARITSARMVPPSDKGVDMPVSDGGYVGMVDREVFDEYLRARAASAGVDRSSGTFSRISRGRHGPRAFFTQGRQVNRIDVSGSHGCGRRRRALTGGQARNTRRRPHALRLRLSRNH
jgi:choline dehydrogenase-like flavoprotein